MGRRLLDVEVGPGLAGRRVLQDRRGLREKSSALDGGADGRRDGEGWNAGRLARHVGRRRRERRGPDADAAGVHAQGGERDDRRVDQRAGDAGRQLLVVALPAAVSGLREARGRTVDRRRRIGPPSGTERREDGVRSGVVERRPATRVARAQGQEEVRSHHRRHLHGAVIMRRGILLFAAIGLALRPAVEAQQPPAFRTSTDIVEVDVVVHDKDGRFVDDLSLQDFELLENGTPQRLEQIDLRGAASSAAGARPSTMTSPAVPVRPAARRIFVFVFDDAHMTANGFKRSQAAANALFEKQFRDGDIGGIAIGGRIAGSRLTTDRAELVKAVGAAKPDLRGNSRRMEEQSWPRLTAAEAVAVAVHNNESVRNAAIQRACVDDEAQCRIADVAVAGKANQLTDEARGESTQTVQLIRTLMIGLERFDGPKTVVLASEGFMTEDSWPLVEDAVALAARANARIYALDARGLNRGLTSLGGSAPGGSDAMTRLLEQMDFGSDSTNSLAIDTGGFVVRNEDDFARAVARIGADASRFYVVGYRSSLPQDGTFHRLRVVVKWPNVAVRARRGYVATPRPLATETSTVNTPPAPAAAEPAPPAPVAAVAVPTPEITPAAERIEPHSTSATSSGGSGLRLRPDAGKHLDILLKNESADAAAKAGWDAFQRGDVATAHESLGAAATDPHAAAWVHYALGMTEYALREYPE